MARKAKQSKWDKAKASKQQSVAKTAASREKRLANKHKREAIQAQHGDVQIVIKDGIPYMNGDKLELVDGVYTVVPTAEDAHEGIEELAKHYGKMEKNIDEQIEKERLYRYKQLEDRHKVTSSEKVATKSAFGRLKDKLRRTQ